MSACGHDAVYEGAASILAAVKAVDPAHRLNALAVALDAFVKTDGRVEVEVTHACPPGDAAVTPCCGRTPFELPRTDRMTLDSALVTCARAARGSEAAAEVAS